LRILLDDVLAIQHRKSLTEGCKLIQMHSLRKA
jgi:hypothetical protein